MTSFERRTPNGTKARRATTGRRDARVLARTESDTLNVGRELGRALAPGTTVLLYGELGAGKTVFVRGLAEGLGLDPENVSSPTFTIVHEYQGGSVTLQHIDLYRLTPAEVADAALDDLAGADTIIAIEWAERLPRPATPPVVEVHLEHMSNGRQITISHS